MIDQLFLSLSWSIIEMNRGGKCLWCRQAESHKRHASRYNRLGLLRTQSPISITSQVLHPLNTSILLITSILVCPLEEVDPRAARHPRRFPQRHPGIHGCASNGANRRTHRRAGYRAGSVKTEVITVLRSTSVVVCGCGPRRFGYGSTGFFEHDVYGFAQSLDVGGDLRDVDANNEVETGGPFLYR